MTQKNNDSKKIRHTKAQKRINKTHKKNEEKERTIIAPLRPCGGAPDAGLLVEDAQHVLHVGGGLGDAAVHVPDMVEGPRQLEEQCVDEHEVPHREEPRRHLWMWSGAIPPPLALEREREGRTVCCGLWVVHLGRPLVFIATTPHLFLKPNHTSPPGRHCPLLLHNPRHQNHNKGKMVRASDHNHPKRAHWGNYQRAQPGFF